MAYDIDNPYLRQKVMTASPQELRLMLLDGALHFVDVGVQGLDASDFEKVYEGFSQAKAIVMELITSLNHEVDADLCARVQSLYSYIYQLLIDASFDRDRAKAEEARERLAYERETWGLLMEKLKDEGVEQGSPMPASPATPQPTARKAPAIPQVPPTGERRSFSVQG